MNAKANKENPTVNAQGAAMETRVVEAVDYRSSAGQGQEVRDVQVTHQLHPSGSENSTTSGGVLAGAAAAVSSTLESARDAISHK